ncbi:hypothetical protein FJV41_46860 [Myxococcus llanfairpwllgwyngyllgogerychwyrndrobwllllantysiliogogogochensis]|uniref:Uncharacterized protein n=1 Tax=Myxococcus llanfairpwllgwyngyllgogerychwyrndrobwllllantysiliogogogochensis TaxID=2590453 RepID=A0A540WKP0_9BACT|nr:hypothetical protein FJV41_46860 [Myxococcus llanfairpwllgwyngyllgogerychwyrndrobwllllantysiliogogogochensis]
MSAPVTPEKPTRSGSVPPSGRVTLFLKPSFGITVKSNALCVAVSAKPRPDNTSETSEPRAVDDSIPCP